MNQKSFVKLSNIVAIVSIILLMYWVFMFISIEVFGFKVFRENIAQSFYLSIFGILALMFAALMLNIMFNLTRIAEKHNRDADTLSPKNSKILVILLIVSFPIIFALLYLGDTLTTKKREKLLIQSADSIVHTYRKELDHLLNYKFSEDWIIETEITLKLFSSTDKNFPHISIIVKDSIENSKVFLRFTHYYHGDLHDEVYPQKVDFVANTTEPERIYLKKVFDDNYSGIRFSAFDGRYELFYPCIKEDRKIVFYFSEYQRYGKRGS